MANNLLTTSMIADRALMILTEKLTFIPSINRDYDDSFARTGAKIGDTLRVRVPQHGTVRTGRIMQPDALNDVVSPITIAQQQGIDMNYSSAELALDIDEFAERYLDQRIADLAVSIEAATLNACALGVPSATGTPTGQLNSLSYPLLANKFLNDQLAPQGDRSILFNTTAQFTTVKALSALFNSQQDIAKQYKNGVMGYAAGFKWAASTVTPIMTPGTFAGAGKVNGANQTGSSIITNGWTANSAVLNAGDVITFAGVNAVHAQTKANLGYLRQFTVTANVVADGSGNATIPISQALTPSGDGQNVTASPANAAALALFGSAGVPYGVSLAYAKDFATFVSADLPLPPKKDAARRVYESISMRVINDFDTINDAFLTRFDVLFGSAILRPELAVRIANDPSNLTP